MVKVAILFVFVLVSLGANAQKLFVSNKTENPLKFYISSWIKPGPKYGATVHTSRVKLLPGKKEELGDTKTIMINEVRVGSGKSILSSRPVVDMESLTKALKRVRKYRNGSITLLFNIEPRGKKIFVTAQSEKETHAEPTEFKASLK